MNAFIKRNTPVFIVGTITFVLFVVIILFSQNNNNDTTIPSLVKVPEQQAEELATEYTPQSIPQPNTTGNTSTNSPVDILPGEEIRAKEVIESIKLTQDEIDAEYGILRVAYTEEGFVPKNTNGYAGQLATFTNESDNPITIMETTVRLPQFATGLTLEPGGTVEFRLAGSRLWTYRETTSGDIGAIFVGTAYIK